MKINYIFVVTKWELILFSWDEAKNKSNHRKHGISFETAKLVFKDPLHITRQDRIENGEMRWQTVGTVGGLQLLLVAHTWLDEYDGSELIRIISVRLATKLERKAYEQST
jgi:uncharacterized protein